MPKQFDYAIHSDFLIHWTGKDIEQNYNSEWDETDKSETKNPKLVEEYIKRLETILKYGLWMTSERKETFHINGNDFTIPSTAKTCFTELKVSESRKHARQYGRLGIGVKRMFLFNRSGRPMVYFGLNKNNRINDRFLEQCCINLPDQSLLNFFKPMNSSETSNYDYYSESEWRILYSKELEESPEPKIIDPHISANKQENDYFNNLPKDKQKILKYLIPLDGWLAMIIYPSVEVKNKAQQDASNGIWEQIKRIKSIKDDQGNKTEGGNWPIELELDSCRNF